ncbi:hypothetical protein SAMN02799641_05878 [Rhodococcus erythropolis]|uniref:hypothetical protein n=1 Tax=Rhodococcus erythropolis TaxID=1833 RepID=UPI0008771EA9|nr:hypothetical protein [Rhodococcus erythropolis]MCS4257997.1 hypothetical protein [Rhodococcus erythropolis]MCW2430108.1 hypothetical protein [Rhodococcus erythropolis]SCZ14923.1 hypothetical protein SAMN02799641_05878 [Rhodococcus erythropolis]
MTAKAVEPATDPETTAVEEAPKVEPVTPEADEPDQKLRLLDWKLQIPWIDLRIPYWCIWIAALFLGMLLGWSFSDGWGATQWGPLASWFAGVATFAAVAIALWQTQLSRRDARQAKLDAARRLRQEQTRHAIELRGANERLDRELNAQRRHQQLISIPPIWDAISEIAHPTQKTISQLKRATSGSPTAISRANDHYREWLPLSIRATTSFTTAFLIVDEPRIIEQLVDTERILQLLCYSLTSANERINHGKYVSNEELEAIEESRVDLLSMRSIMMKSAKDALG